jgi:hypothetical protein
METVEELKLNAKHRSEALEPVVLELQILNKKTEEVIQLLCDLLRKYPR